MIDEYHLRLLAIQEYADGFFAKFVIYENKYNRQFIIPSLLPLLSVYIVVLVYHVYVCV